MRFPELDAFAEECRAIDATLATVNAEDWTLPAIGEWNVAPLVAHLVRGAGRVAEYLDQDPGAEVPAVDRVSYWRVDLEAAAPEIAQRAIDAAVGVDPAEWPARFTAAWRSSAGRARTLPPARLIATPHGAMRLDEYLATRVLEAVVHHMDLCAALARPPVAAPQAARMTMAILEGLLGGPKPRAMGRARFILAATGRLAVDDPRFPVLR